MADIQTADTTQQDTQTADTTQQVTSQIPTTRVITKNPKRVAAGKATAEKRRLAREEQNKKIAEADAIKANERLRKAQEEARKAEEVVAPPVEVSAAPPAAKAESQNLTTTQWLSVASIIVSLAAIYYKREEIKGAIEKVKAPAPMKSTAPVNVVAPKKSGIRPMDSF